ncbi:adenylate cyclase [Planctomycetales bacterium]|nr:adenylate cyclase [Planctomycetales bacterium]
MYEVEIKFAVNDSAVLKQRLENLNIAWLPEMTEEDVFYQHPSRDFRQTDEALRMRQIISADGSQLYTLTYKGPKLDKETKTRQEIEIPLAMDAQYTENVENMKNILTALGFRQSGFVHKIRNEGTFFYANRGFNVCLDELPELAERNRSSHFIELETLADSADWQSARDAVKELAVSLGLKDSIQNSYLELLSDSAFSQ